MTDPLYDMLKEEAGAGNTTTISNELAIESKKLQILRNTLGRLIQNMGTLAINKKDEEAKNTAEAAVKVIRALIATISTRQQTDFKKVKRSREVERMHLRNQQEFRNQYELLDKDIGLLNKLLKALEDQTVILISMESYARQLNTERVSALWDRLVDVITAEAQLVNELRISEEIIERQMNLLSSTLNRAKIISIDDYRTRKAA